MEMIKHMNQENEENILETFLAQVKERLPGYIKEKNDELADVLEEIRERVLDKAEAVTTGNVITDEIIRQVIVQMGGARKVANQYKRKGTPKYFLSKELWPFYKRIMLIVAGAILLANVVALVVNLLSGRGQAAVWEMASGLQGGIFAAFTIVTLIFVWLSMEGYMPEDFEELAKKDEKRGKGKAKKPKKPFNRAGKFAEAGVAIVVALLMITLPFPLLRTAFHPEFIFGIGVLGYLALIGGLLNFAEGMVGTRHMAILQAIKIAGTIVSLFGIGFIVMLIQRPEIIPFFSFGGDGELVVMVMPEEFYQMVRIGLTALVAIIVLASIVEVVETILLRRKVKKYQQSLL